MLPGRTFPPAVRPCSVDHGTDGRRDRQQLAASRHAVEIGQQQLAHKTGCSRSSFAHAEAGRQLLTRAFWTTAEALVETLVEADSALLAGYEQVHAAQQDHELCNAYVVVLTRFPIIVSAG